TGLSSPTLFWCAPMRSAAAPSDSMKGDDIVVGHRPDRSRASLFQKPKPDNNVVTDCTQRVPGARTVQRKFQKKTIKVGVIKRAIGKDRRNVPIKAIYIAGFLKSDLACHIFFRSAIPNICTSYDGGDQASHRQLCDERGVWPDHPLRCATGLETRNEQMVQTVKITRPAPRTRKPCGH
ncbi:hypothetical protein LCGC14_2664970, partial [marine sediment metagenome]